MTFPVVGLKKANGRLFHLMTKKHGGQKGARLAAGGGGKAQTDPKSQTES